MRLPGALFLMAIFLQVSFCNGAMVQTISQLAASKAEIREQAEKNLFAADSGELLEGLTNFVQSPESNPRAAEAGILFLRKKDVELPNRLLPIANKIPSPQVRAALLNSVVLSRNDTNALKSVVSLLKDTNLIVRLSAAELVKNRKENMDAVLKIGFQSLSSDEAEWLGDPPRPAAIIGKQLLASLKNKKAVLDFLHQQTIDTDRVKYHTLDLISVLSRKTPRFIYVHIGNPTAKEVELLSKQ